jgi:hypothetical protein
MHLLTIGIRYPMSRMSDRLCQPIATHALTTLRIQHIGPVLRAEVEAWDCPNLTHIMSDSSLMWETYSPLFGPRIEVTELIKDESLHILSALGVIEQCPNLRELNYLVEYARFPDPPLYHDSLQCIRLHSGRNYMIDLADTWEWLKTQFSLFAGHLFHALKQIILYGDWSDILRNPQFHSLKDVMLRRGCVMETETTSPILTQA